MKNNRAFSIVELLVGIIVSSILILTIGVISSMGNAGHTKALNTQVLYNDISYGFKLIKNKVRSSDSIAVNATPTDPPWKSSVLLVNHQQVVGGVATVVQGAFGVYQAASSTTQAFVYMPDVSVPATFESILSLSTTETLNLIFTSVTASSLTMQLNGQKDNIPFDVTNVVLRRNP